MQDPKTSKTRKPWYQRAIEMTTPWKTTFRKIPLTPTDSTTTINLWKTLKSTETQSQNYNYNNNNTNKQKLRKCTSLKVATSFTRVCLCAPISSYTEVFNTEALPRRSYSYPRSSKPLPTTTTTMATMPATIHHPHHQLERVVGARLSVDGRRRVFRGKSLMDDVLMRRFVIEEEAMMQVRRRNEIEIIRKRAILRRKKLGPSPLSRMSMT